jgi:2-hydroxy-3-keto-5-methylthiopentenyl-1-phosphate phosphatase
MHMLDGILIVHIGINSWCLVKIKVTPSFHTTHTKILTVTGKFLCVSHEINMFVPCVFDSKHQTQFLCVW